MSLPVAMALPAVADRIRSLTARDITEGGHSDDDDDGDNGGDEGDTGCERRVTLYNVDRVALASIVKFVTHHVTVPYHEVAKPLETNVFDTIVVDPFDRVSRGLLHGTTLLLVTVYSL